MYIDLATRPEMLACIVTAIVNQLHSLANTLCYIFILLCMEMLKPRVTWTLTLPCLFHLLSHNKISSNVSTWFISVYSRYSGGGDGYMVYVNVC